MCFIEESLHCRPQDPYWVDLMHQVRLEESDQIFPSARRPSKVLAEKVRTLAFALLACDTFLNQYDLYGNMSYVPRMGLLVC